MIGFFAQDLQSITLSSVSYAGNPKFTVGPEIAETVRSSRQFFWQHGLAHLTMLHGVFSISQLPFSQYAFNIPAWSISLEWQFYILAPFIIMLALRPEGLVYMALPIVVAEVAWRSGWAGQYVQPSCLPAAAAYFVVGIASRLLYPEIAGRVRNPMVIVALIVVICPLFRSDTIPLLAWVIILAGLATDRSDAAETPFVRLYRLLLESRLALYFGSRSYSAYLSHMLVIAFCHWTILGLFPAMRPAGTFLCLSALTVPLTIGLAELFYRGVELPGIALGSRWARRTRRQRLSTVPGE